MFQTLNSDHECLIFLDTFREGGSHSVYVNRIARKTSTVPRHKEINKFLARKICRDLDVPEPGA